jgi:hypothetical protein
MHNIYLNTLEIVLKYELSKVRNLGNEMWQHVNILYKNGSEHYSKKWYYKKSRMVIKT